MHNMLRVSPLYLLIFSLHLFPAGGAEVFPAAKHGRGELHYVDSIPVAILAGSPEEIGRQHAELLLRHSTELMQFPKRFFTENGLGFFYPFAAEGGKTLMRNAPPRYQQEIDAASKIARLEPEILAVANTLLELRRVGCSSLIVEPEKSATGGPLFGRNFDFPAFGLLDRFGLVTVVRPTGRRAFAAVGFPGMMGVLSGINDAGLCVATLDVEESADESSRFDAKGVPMALVFRQVLEQCTALAEAESLLKGVHATTRANLAVCDRERGAVFEITPDQVKRRDSEDALLPCTNHFRSPGLALDKQCWRYDRLVSAGGADSLNVAEIQGALHQANQGGLTLQTMVFEPRESVLHLSLGSPPSSAHKMHRLELSELLSPSK
jgi:isopenicillin-N N-acyltransferase like protein